MADAPLEPIAQCAASGDVEQRRACGRCGSGVRGDVDRCPRCGCWLPANAAAVTHGARRMALLARPEVVAELAETRNAILEDLGGVDVVSHLAASLVDSFVAATVLERHVLDNLARHGVLTARGRSRSVANQLLGIIDRKIRLAQALGLERRRRVPVDPLSAIRTAVEKANRP